MTYLLRSDAGAHARYQYDPYGRTLSATGTLASANLLRFSSKPVVLSATGGWGNYYYGYRFYDPNTQRWLNRDPIREWGGVSLYGFVWNNPNTFSDSDGDSPHTWVARGGFLVGSIIGDYLYDDFIDPILDDYLEDHVDPDVAANLDMLRDIVDAARTAKSVPKMAKKVLDRCKLHRPTLRKGTKEAIDAKTARAEDGRFLDPDGTPTSNPVYGHKHGHENWREIEKAESPSEKSVLDMKAA